MPTTYDIRRMLNLIEAAQSKPLKEALWWVTRWVSGSMNDPDWDDSWCTLTPEAAFAVVQEQVGNSRSINKPLYRYLELTSSDLRKMRRTKVINANPRSIFQSFTTSAEKAIEAGELIAPHPLDFGVVVSVQPPPELVMFGMADLMADRRASSEVAQLADWHHQDEVVVKIIEPMPILGIKMTRKA